MKQYHTNIRADFPIKCPAGSKEWTDISIPTSSSRTDQFWCLHRVSVLSGMPWQFYFTSPGCWANRKPFVGSCMIKKICSFPEKPCHLEKGMGEAQSLSYIPIRAVGKGLGHWPGPGVSLSQLQRTWKAAEHGMRKCQRWAADKSYR